MLALICCIGHHNVNPSLLQPDGAMDWQRSVDNFCIFPGVEALQCYNCLGITHYDQNECFEPNSEKTVIQECLVGQVCEVSTVNLGYDEYFAVYNNFKTNNSVLQKNAEAPVVSIQYQRCHIRHNWCQYQENSAEKEAYCSPGGI